MSTYNGYFKPTFLYIKRHKLTGLKYFGKTVSSNPERYLGSGVRWNRHIKKHGIEHVETLWFCLFLDVNSVQEFATMFSIQEDIVKSKDWANIINEDGVGGFSTFSNIGKQSPEHIRKRTAHRKGVQGQKHSEEVKRKNSEVRMGAKNHFYGQKHTKEAIDKMSKAASERPPRSEEWRDKHSFKMKNQPPRSEEYRKNISLANKGKNAGQIFIRKDGVIKKVSKIYISSFLDAGWIIGRGPKSEW